MRPKQIIIDLDAPDDDNTFILQTTAGAGAITLNGVGVVAGEWISGDGFAKRIDLTSAGDVSAVNFTIVGFADIARHIPLTEVIAGPNTNTVTTTSYFAVITDITVDGAVGTNTKGGNTDEAVTNPIPLNWRAGTMGMSVDVTGTINYTVQHTFDPLEVANFPFTWNSSDTAALVTGTTDQDGVLYAIPLAARVLVNSYSAGAEIAFTIVQSNA